MSTCSHCGQHIRNSERESPKMMSNGDADAFEEVRKRIAQIANGKPTTLDTLTGKAGKDLAAAATLDISGHDFSIVIERSPLFQPIYGACGGGGGDARYSSSQNDGGGGDAGCYFVQADGGGSSTVKWPHMEHHQTPPRFVMAVVTPRPNQADSEYAHLHRFFVRTCPSTALEDVASLYNVTRSDGESDDSLRDRVLARLGQDPLA